SWAPKGVHLTVGRLEPAVRTGLSAVLLSGQAPLDGVMVASARPFRLPGAMGRIGSFQGHLFVSPSHETPTVTDAWFTSYGLGWSPVPSLDFGVARTIRFGGAGQAPFTAANLWNMIAFGGGDSSFDDSQGEISMRARLRLGNLRLGLYGALGFEDLKAITEDPALTVGFSLPVVTDAGMVAVGYEFLGIGPRGIWCGCDAVSHSWYTQREYGPYATEEGLLGAALGGYGAAHYLTASFWSTPYPVFVRMRVFLEDRSEENLLNGRWPGERRGVRMEVGLGPWQGLRLAVGATTTSTEVGTESGAEVFVQALSLGRLLSRP
ncbi:MAG: capsule assembly Wzi family protein, partial [Gemmatimonadota bacterium]|nr:capsule assembly Wzi family protein [Gemmatimonadota bacterium]